MNEVTHFMGGGLTQQQLDAIHRTALRVLREVGVAVELPEVRRRIAGERGVSIDETRVRLAPDLVEEHVEGYRSEHAGAPGPADEFTIDVLTGFAFRVLDPAADELRPMNTDDCVAGARLVDALHEEGVRGGTPGLPQDVPLPLREILAYKIGCENSRTAAHVGVTSMRGAEIIYEMSQVVDKPFDLPVFVLSPLRVAGESISMAVEFLDRGWNVRASVHGMPLLGLTTPLMLPAAFADHVATVLGAYVIFQLMGIGDGLTYHFDVYPFDMKFGTIAYGTPQHILSHLIGAQVNRYYGASTRSCKAFHTNAGFPDAHSISQRASFATVAALNGARNFTFGGMLGIDKTFSAEQLLVDVEIVRYLEHLVRGYEFGDEETWYDTIREGGPGGDFLTHPTTLNGFRDLWVSDLFENRSPEQWEAAGKTMLKDRVLARLEELRDSYDFDLGDDVRRELDRIYEAAVQELT